MSSSANVGGWGVQIVGIDECVKALEKLKIGVRKRVVAKAVRAGAAPVVKAAKKNAPRDTGLLKKSIGQKVRRYKNGYIAAIVGPRNIKAGRENPGKYGHLTEGDVRPHALGKGSHLYRAAKERTLKVKGGTKVYKYKAIEQVQTGRGHPGYRGRHWLRAAYRATRAQALNGFEAKFREGLKVEIAKARAIGIKSGVAKNQ